MNNGLRKAASAILGLTVLVALASEADARSIAGNAAGLTPGDCWQGMQIDIASGPLLNCSPSNSVEFVTWSLPIDSSGTKNVNFFTSLPVVNGTPTYAYCVANGRDNNRTSQWSSGLLLNKQGSTILTGNVTLSGQAFVPGWGHLDAYCEVTPQGGINSLAWDP